MCDSEKFLYFIIILFNETDCHNIVINYAGNNCPSGINNTISLPVSPLGI